jgi:single-strand DNA-binding protein
MKNLTIAGRLTKDATTREAGSDKVTGFSVAVDDRQGKEKSTLFFDCSMWGKRGETLAQYLVKGSQVTVSGDLGTREYEGKTYLTLRVADVSLQGGKAAASGGDDGASGVAFKQADGSVGRYDLSDDIPF